MAGCSCVFAFVALKVTRLNLSCPQQWSENGSAAPLESEPMDQNADNEVRGMWGWFLLAMRHNIASPYFRHDMRTKTHASAALIVALRMCNKRMCPGHPKHPPWTAR